MIFPGSYHFKTDAAEIMEIIEGHCVVVLDGEEGVRQVHPSESFAVPQNSGFSIQVEGAPCHYICRFLS